jgi:hypothetical protein
VVVPPPKLRIRGRPPAATATEQASATLRDGKLHMDVIVRKWNSWAYGEANAAEIFDG